MLNRLSVLAAAALLAAGCYIVAPFPGGYVGVGIPPATIRVRGSITAHWGVIPGTTIYYSPGLADILYYNGHYYYVVNGTWYVGPHYTGPWYIPQTVPDVFLRIPPAHPCFHIATRHPRYHYARHTRRPEAHTAIRPHTPPTKGKPGEQMQEKEEEPALPPHTPWVRGD